MNYSVTIDKSLFEKYPEIRLGLLEFKADVKEPDACFWEMLNTDVLPKVRSNIENLEWSQIEGVRGSRNAYKAFGRNPSRYRVSSEALLRRVKREDELYHINTVVDVNNLISVKSGLSVGSYDLSKINGDITLRVAQSGEGYIGIGKEFIDMENMLVLSDSDGIFGSSMSDSTRAMVTLDTKDILVVVYCFENSINLESLLDEAKEAFGKYADANAIKVWSI